MQKMSTNSSVTPLMIPIYKNKYSTPKSAVFYLRSYLLLNRVNCEVVVDGNYVSVRILYKIVVISNWCVTTPVVT